jgi:mRNA-degrading endonuclease toxin of MazEF toxin-antitoxin module
LNLVDAAEPLRVRIPASGGLKRESDAPIDQLRAIDNRRLARGPLARLPDAPVRRVEAAILEVLEIVERDGDGPQRPG